MTHSWPLALRRTHGYVAVALILAASLSAACRRGGAPAPGAAVIAATAPTPQPLSPAATVYYDNGGGIQDSLRVVVRDEATLRDFWRRATSTQPSPPPLPAVDFSREMVVVVSGGRMSPADQIRVDSAGVRDEVGAPGARQRVLEVVVRTVRACQTFNSEAYPVAIVRVPRVEGSVRFTERRERGAGCPGAAGAPPATRARLGSR